MAILPSLKRGQKILPAAQVVPAASLTELWGARSSSMNWRGTPRLDYCPQARVGTLLIGACAPVCGLHEEERVLKVLPKITGWGNWRSGPWTPLHEGSLRCHWWHHYPGGQTNLSRGMDLGSQHAFLLSAWWLHEGIAAGVEQMHG